MNWKYLTALTFINAVYLVVGGCIFYIIEHPEAEKEEKSGLKNLIAFEQTILKNVTCLTQQDLHQLIQRVLYEYDQGTISLVDTNPWSIEKAIFFSSSIVTTIGYGYVTPKTSGGRVFCCIYALLGIPLFLTMLGAIGKKINELGKYLDSKLNHGYFSESTGKSLRALILFVIGFSLLILAPAAIIKLVEGWTFEESIYYGVITLTTVGFGDYVPGHEEGKLYRWYYFISLTCWIMVGLAWAAAMIANVQDLYHTVMYADRKEKQESIEDSDNSVSTKEDIPLVTEEALQKSYTEENPKKQ